MLLDERLGAEVKRAAFGEGDVGEVVREGDGPYLPLLSIYPNGSFAVLRVIVETDDGIEGDEPVVLVPSRTGRPAPVRAALMVASVDVHKDDSSAHALRLGVANDSMRIATVLLAQPDVGVIRGPVDLETGAIL